MPITGNEKKEADGIARLEARSLSNTKPHFINDNSARTDVNGYAIQATGTNNVTFSTLTVNNLDGSSNDISNMTLQPGFIVYLNVKDITLSAGEVIVYELK